MAASFADATPIPGHAVVDANDTSSLSQILYDTSVSIRTPTKSDGSALFLDEVTHSDMSEVKRVALNAFPCRIQSIFAWLAMIMLVRPR